MFRLVLGGPSRDSQPETNAYPDLHDSLLVLQELGVCQQLADGGVSIAIVYCQSPAR